MDWRRRLFLHPCSSVLLLAFSCAAALPSAGAEPIQTSGEIESAVVFRHQARVTRRIEVPATESPVELTVTGLPESLVSGSAFVEGEDGVSVRKVRVFRSRMPDPNREAVEDLEAQYTELQQQLADAKHRQAVVQANLETLKSMVDFSARQSQQNLDRATLDVAAVTGLTDFAFERRVSLADQQHEIDQQIAELTEKIRENEQRLQQLAAEPLPVKYEARMTIEPSATGITEVRLRYDVSDCSWTSAYVVRGRSGQSQYSLLGNAEIVQNSGEDWADARVTLSTAIPSQSSDGPDLSPLRVSSSESPQVPEVAGRLAARIAAAARADIGEDDLMLNQAAGLEQLRELRQPHQVQRRLAADAGLELIGETFVLDQRVHLASRRQPQTVRVFEHQFEGEMTRLLMPLLSSYAHRQVKLTNTLPHGLMAGPADVFLNGQSVGTTRIPATATGGPLSIGFGPDHQIRTRRELMDRQETTRGGNRLISLRYRLVVSNLRDKAVDCRLFDRIPISDQTGAVVIRLSEEAEESLSDDPLYQRMQRPVGILRWDLNVAANRFGSEALDVEYEYQIELDRSLHLTSREMIEQMQRDQQFQQYNKAGGGMGGGMGGMSGGTGGFQGGVFNAADDAAASDGNSGSTDPFDHSGSDPFSDGGSTDPFAAGNAERPAQ